MRNPVLALTALFLSASLAHGQAAWADKLFGGKTTHDFGSVPRGAQLSYRFEIKNIYAVPLEIINARVSCGCVKVTPTVRMLPSGRDPSAGPVYLDVVMDTARFTGPKTVSIFVTVGPEYVSTATLQVSAHIRADVVFNPGEINFGVVPRGQSARQTVDVEYAGVLDWRISDVVVSPSAALSAGFKEIYRRPGHVGYRIEVALKPDAPPGALKEIIHLRTNDRVSPLVPLLAEGNVQAPLTAAPNHIAFREVKPGTSKEMRVFVRGSQPFRILTIDGLGDGLTASIPPTAAANQIVTVRWQPQQSASIKRQLFIRTDLPNEQPVIVSVEGVGATTMESTPAASGPR